MSERLPQNEDIANAEAQLFAQAMHIASRATTSLTRPGVGHFTFQGSSRGRFVSMRCGPTQLIICLYGLIALPFLSSGFSSSETSKNVLVGVALNNSSSSTTAETAAADESSDSSKSDAFSVVIFLFPVLAFLFASFVLVRRSVVVQRMELLNAERERRRQQRTLAALTGSDALFARTFGPSNGLSNDFNSEGGQTSDGRLSSDAHIHAEYEDNRDLERIAPTDTRRATTSVNALDPHAFFRRAWRRDVSYAPVRAQDGSSRDGRSSDGSHAANSSGDSVRQSMAASAWNALFGSNYVSSEDRGFQDVNVEELEAFMWTALQGRVGPHDRQSLVPNGTRSDGAASFEDRRSNQTTAVGVGDGIDLEVGIANNLESNSRMDMSSIEAERRSAAAEGNAVADPSLMPPSQFGLGQRRPGRRNAVTAMSAEVLAAARAAAADVGDDAENDGGGSSSSSSSSGDASGSAAGGLAGNAADNSFPPAAEALPVRILDVLDGVISRAFVGRRVPRAPNVRSISLFDDPESLLENWSYRDDFYQQLLALDRVEFGGRPGNFPEDTPLPSSQPHQRVCSAAELAILPTRTLDVDDVAAARDSIAVGERAALAAAAAASASSANYAATPTLATAATTAAAATAAFGQNCDQHAANPTAQARDLQQTDELSSLVQYSQEGCAVCLEPWQLNDLVRSLPCRHFLHAACVDPWLTKGSAHCPVCKQPVVPYVHTSLVPMDEQPEEQPSVTPSAPSL